MCDSQASQPDEVFILTLEAFLDSVEQVQYRLVCLYFNNKPILFLSFEANVDVKEPLDIFIFVVDVNNNVVFIDVELVVHTPIVLPNRRIFWESIGSKVRHLKFVGLMLIQRSYRVHVLGARLVHGITFADAIRFVDITFDLIEGLRLLRLSARVVQEVALTVVLIN
jgi:hypothetical protein